MNTRRLTALSKKTKKKRSEIIREAIDEHLEPSSRSRKPVPKYSMK
jgi:predicted DNA-binding protein